MASASAVSMPINFSVRGKPVPGVTFYRANRLPPSSIGIEHRWPTSTICRSESAQRLEGVC